jgi:hypothetical protein
MAYAHALGEAKILTEDEKNLILAGLKKVQHNSYLRLKKICLICILFRLKLSGKMRNSLFINQTRTFIQQLRGD